MTSTGTTAPGVRWPQTMAPVTALCLAMAFVLTRFISPNFLDNEAAYSIGPLMVAHPGFLGSQPLLPEMARISIVYNVLLSPLFWALGAFWGSIVCRVLILAFQVWALSRLARALGLAPWSLLVALALWLGTEQSLVAGELVLAGAATKPIAWGFVFLAGEALARQDWRRLPVWAGLATCFHVLVGGWTTLGLLVVLLLLRRDALGWRGFLRFLVITGLLALPAVLPGLLTLKAGDPGVAREAARISVLFANPFHQDPAFFLSPMEGVKVIVVAVGAILLWRLLAAEPVRQLVPGLLGALGAFFIVGLIARAAQAFWILQYYPFRVADAMFPLFFWLGVALAFQRWYERRPRLLRFVVIPVVIGTAGWLIDQAKPSPRYDGVGGFAKAMLKTEPRLTGYWIRTQGEHWLAHFQGKRSAFQRLEDWARLNTPPDAVFITPPWIIEWPIVSERATWISFKVIAPGPSLLEWKRRFEALHGGPYSRVGFGILQELRGTYPLLTAEWARGLTRIGPAHYLIAFQDVPGLTLLHREKGYRLYSLQERP